MSKFVRGFEKVLKKKKEDYPLNNQYTGKGALYHEDPESLTDKKALNPLFTPSTEMPDHGG